MLMGHVTWNYSSYRLYIEQLTEKKPLAGESRRSKWGSYPVCRCQRKVQKLPAWVSIEFKSWRFRFVMGVPPFSSSIYRWDFPCISHPGWWKIPSINGWWKWGYPHDKTEPPHMTWRINMISSWFASGFFWYFHDPRFNLIEDHW